MDDLLLFTPSKKAHIAKLEDLLKALRKDGLKISPKKCQLLLCKVVCSIRKCLGANLLLIYIYRSHVLQYTTACLQVLFSSQHLGGIAKVSQ